LPKKIIKNKLLKLKTIIIALFFSLTLSYSENYSNNQKLISDADEYNAVKLAISAYESIKAGRIPVRVVDKSFCNLGYPIHQFYSPFPSIFVALLSFVNGNIYTGFALGVIIVLICAFIFIFLTIKYLFNDNIYALTGAIIYLYSPYTSISRVSRGAFAEFFALCLLPAVLYFVLRLMGRLSFKYFVLSIISLVILLNCHLVISAYFLVFSGIFLAMHLIIIFIDFFQRRQRQILIRFTKRFIVLSAIVLFSVGISFWSLLPIINYENIYIKQLVNDNILDESSYLTEILSLFSIADATPSFNTDSIFFRLQTGLILNLSLILFIILSIKIRSSFNIPLVITQLVVIALIVYPFSNNEFIEKIFFLTQFTYRFIIYYQILGIFITIIVIKTIVNRCRLDSKLPIQVFICIIISIYSILSASAYQNKLYYQQMYPKIISIEEIRDNDYFLLQPNFAYQYYPNDANALPSVNSKFLVNPISRKNPADQTFIVNLNDYSSKDNFTGYLDFNILFYPGLQYINYTIDGVHANNILLSMNKSNILALDEKYLFLINIYGFRLENLPRSGLLKVRVVFEGYPLANLISILSFVFFLLMIVWYLGRLLIDRKKGRKYGRWPKNIPAKTVY
jgi:hypothetical protein